MKRSGEASGARFVSDVVLLVSALLLSGVTAWLLGRPALPPRGESRLLAGLSASVVSQLSIDQGADKLVLRRAGPREQAALAAFDVSPGEWVVQGASPQPADTAAVHGWLGSLLSARTGLPAALPSGVPTARVDLAGAFAAVSLSFHQGSMGWTVVVQRAAARRAFRIRDETAEGCLPDTGRLQDSRVAPVLRRQVRGVKLSRWGTRPGPAAGEPSVLRWEQQEGQARLSTVVGAQRASPSAMRAFWLALAALRVDRRLSQKQADQALALGARVEVELALEDGARPLRFRVGGVCPPVGPSASESVSPSWVVVRLSPPLSGCLPAAGLGPLLRPAVNWVDYSLFEGNIDSVQGLRIGLGDPIDVRRRADGYWLEGDAPQALAEEAVRARLAMLLALRGQPTPAPDQPGPPLGEVALTEADSAGSASPGLSQRVSFYRAGLALRHADSTWLRLGAAARGASELPPEVLPDTTLLRSLQVFDYPPKRVLGLEVTAAGMQQRLDRRGDQLVLESPSGAPLDAKLGPALVKACGQLRARRWVSDRQRPPGYGLSEPRLRAALRVANGAEPLQRILRVGHRTRDGFFAAVDRYPGVFVLGREVVQLLSQQWVSRHLFSLDEPKWAWVRLEAGGRVGGTVELSRQPYGWAIASGDLRPELAPQLVQALTGIVAEQIVRSGVPLRSEGRAQPLLRVSAGSRPESTELRWFVGARDALSGVSIHYAWRSDRAEVYAVSRARVRRLLALLGQ